MFSHFLSQVARFITDTIDAMGYGGIFLLMGVSSSGIPLPSEVILPFSGVLADKGHFSLLGIALFGALGSLCGTIALYLIGKNFGRAFFIRYGKYLFVSHRELSLAESFFQKYGWLAVFLGQLLPLIRTYIAFPAGMVDNASTDGSEIKAKELFPQIKLIQMGENKGYSAGCNAGVREAQGEFVLLLNPDVILLPKCLPHLLAFAKANPQAGAVAPKLLDPEGSLQPSIRGFPYPLSLLLLPLSYMRK
jgi:membrane protein YqaA with SNARE-associated domain